MRKYYLASADDRNGVDLQNFQNEIIEVVHRYLPHAQVVVEKEYYTVDPTPDRGDAIRIGRQLSKNEVMGRYCIKISKLFCSEEVEYGKEVENGTEKKCIGGHQ